MTELILNLPSLPDPDRLGNVVSSMTNEEKLIQSMRGVTSTVSMLIPAWHFLLAAETAYPDAKSSKDYPRHVKVYFMKEVMLDTLLLYLRRLFETDDRSLATGTILTLLCEKDAVESLRKRSRDVLGSAALDDCDFDAHVAILKLCCGIHLVPEGTSKDPILERMGTQTRLVRRAANKRTAHITLDEYSVGLDDLHQLISNAIGIARQVHAILGNDAGDFDCEAIDRAGFEASKQIFGSSHGGGLLTADPLSRHTSPTEPHT